MDDAEVLKQKIKSEQQKLDSLLKKGGGEILKDEKTFKLSQELDKLIVELQRLKDRSTLT